MRSIINGLAHWRRAWLGFALVGLLAVVAACGEDATPTPTGAAPTATSPAPTATATPLPPGVTPPPPTPTTVPVRPTPTPTATPIPAWQIDWEQTLAAAIEEGAVVTVGSRAAYRISQEAFQKFFPDIEVSVVVARGSAAARRLIQEAEAGIHTVDVMAAGGTGRRPLVEAGLIGDTRSLIILPENTGDENWVGTFADHWLDDVTQKFGFALQSDSAGASTWVNTDFVDRETFRDYADVLKPEFLGRWCMFDPRRGGAGVGFVTQGFLIHGKDFIRNLLETNTPIILADGRRITELMLRGECIIATGATPDPFHQVGLAANIVDVHFAKANISPEYAAQLKITCCGTTRDPNVIDGWTSSGVGGPAWMLRGPNPNAAKIFLNWQLSRQGAIEYQLPRAFPDGRFVHCSPRTDILEEFGCARAHPVDGLSYVGLDYDTNSRFEREGEDLAEEIFGR